MLEVHAQFSRHEWREADRERGARCGGRRQSPSPPAASDRFTRDHASASPVGVAGCESRAVAVAAGRVDGLPRDVAFEARRMGTASHDPRRLPSLARPRRHCIPTEDRRDISRSSSEPARPATRGHLCIGMASSRRRTQVERVRRHDHPASTAVSPPSRPRAGRPWSPSSWPAIPTTTPRSRSSRRCRRPAPT